MFILKTHRWVNEVELVCRGRKADPNTLHQRQTGIHLSEVCLHCIIMRKWLVLFRSFGKTIHFICLAFVYLTVQL